MMAKKKSSKQKSPSPKEFSSSPFKSLKGLSALVPPQTESQLVEDKPTTTAAWQKHADDQHAFADEMNFLRVKPLSGAVVEQSGPEADRAAKFVTSSGDCLQNDRAAFLDAVGSMGKTFKDEWPEEELAKQAVPRRMRQVERGQLKPEAELNLHGLTIKEACSKARFFLQDSVYQGVETVLIITGKGLHSSDGPVLRQSVEQLLDQQREQVIEWGVAPRRYGGDGALVVFLR